MVALFIYFCLLPIAHGGIGSFTAVRIRSLWLIKMSINRTGCGHNENDHLREINTFLSKISIYFLLIHLLF